VEKTLCILEKAKLEAVKDQWFARGCGRQGWVGFVNQ
jgi:hypothetical protein